MCTPLNKGEVCLSGSRLFVHEKVRDEFPEKYTRANTVVPDVRLRDPLAASRLDRPCSIVIATKDGSRFSGSTFTSPPSRHIDTPAFDVMHPRRLNALVAGIWPTSKRFVDRCNALTGVSNVQGSTPVATCLEGAGSRRG
jgi:hypothetical protein